MQDVTWLVFVKSFWTRITSVFILGRDYHRICHQLNMFGINSVDVFAIVKIQRKHYGSCVTQLCTSGTTSSFYPTIDWFYMRRRCEAVFAARGGHTRYWTPQTSILHDNFCLSMICSDDVEKFCWYCLICYAPMDMNLNYAIFVDFFPLCKKYYLFVMHCQNYYLSLYFKIIFRRFLLAYNRIFY